MGRLPDFLIIGAMKCGTSTLHEQLALRTGLFMSDPKEPNFFSDDDRYARGLGWYQGLFAGAQQGQRCGESSTHYTKLPTYPHALDRLASTLPEPRLIYVMRDPVARLVSQYIHEWSQREFSGTLAAAVRSQERFVAYSAYAHQLEPWLDTFGHQAVLPVFFERMLEDPDPELARVCRFIGDPSPEPPVWERDLPPQNVSSQRVRRSPLRDALLRRSLVKRLRQLVPPTWRDVARRPWQMHQRPELSEALRSEIEARLDPDLARLGRWLGRPLACHSWKATVLEQPLEWLDPRPGAADGEPA